jgi:acetyl esterase/lipase
MLRKKAQDLLPSVWRRLCIRRSRERHSAHLTRTGRPSMSQGDVVENPCGTNHPSSGLRRGPQYVVSALRLRADFVLYSTLVLHGWVTVFPLRAQTDLSLLQNPILDESDRRSMMFSFVERNLPPIELPATLAAWEARKPILLEQIHRLVGLEDLQHRGPIKWIARGLLDRDAYTIEKILYESYPGMMVPALVYTPKGLTAPAAAIVSITGHTTCDGKANVEAQARSVNLVRRGLIVVTYDYMGTFERNTGVNPCAGLPYGGGNDHGLRGFSYTSGTPTGLEILDGIRAIDYLYARKDVDRNRIAFTGESGGSNSTYWVAALDNRVRLAVPVCSVTSFDYWIRNDRNWDWHQRPPGIRRVADISTLLALVAPRPLLVTAALRGTDSYEFPFDETARAVNQAKKIYNLYGVGDSLQFWESNTSHGYQQDKRERMYGWVERHFLRRDVESSREIPFLFEPRTELICGLPAANKTFADIYREWILRPTPVPVLPGDSTEALHIQREFRQRLQERLGLPAQDSDPTLHVKEVTSRSDEVIRQLIVETEPGIRMPATEFSPKDQAPSATIIFLGRSPDFLPAIPEILSQRLRAVLVDVRGTGEINSGGGRTDNWAWLIGRPWPGLWVQDIQGIVSALSDEYPNRPIGLLGSGGLGKSALFAAALTPRIAAVVAEISNLSYRKEANVDSLSDVPRFLAAMDLPMVVALVAPRYCWIHYPSDIDDEEFRSSYGWSVSFYERSQADTQALRLQVGKIDWQKIAGWFADVLKADLQPAGAKSYGKSRAYSPRSYDARQGP